MISSYLKQLIGSGIFFLMVVSANAQTAGPDIVELKSGEKHQGLIVEQRPGNYLRLVQKPSSDTLTLHYSDITALYKSAEEASAPQMDTDSMLKSAPETPLPTAFNQRRIYAGISTAVSGGDWRNTGLGAQLHYTVLPSLKAGVSLQFYWGDGHTAVMDQILPVSLDVLYTIQSTQSGRMSLLAGSSIGCAFVQQRNYYSTKFETDAELSRGLFYSASLGGQVNFTRNTGLRVEVGYQYVGAKAYRLGTDDFLQRNKQSNIFLRGTVFF